MATDGQSTVISVTNGVQNSGATDVDLVFGDVVALVPVTTGDGWVVLDGHDQIARRAIFGVVSGKQGIPAGGSGPVVIKGEAYAMCVADGSNAIAIGAYLDVSNTAWGSGTTPANGAAAAAVSFEETSQATVHNVGALAEAADGTKVAEFLNRTRARMVNGTITAASAGPLAGASSTRTLCLVEVFNNP